MFFIQLSWPKSSSRTVASGAFAPKSLLVLPLMESDINGQKHCCLTSMRWLQYLVLRAFVGWLWNGECSDKKTLAEDHRSWTCPGPLAAPTGFEVQPPHRRRRSSAPRLLHGGGAHYSYFLEFLHPPDQFFPPNTRSVLSRKHYSSYKTHILQWYMSEINATTIT